MVSIRLLSVLVILPSSLIPRLLSFQVFQPPNEYGSEVEPSKQTEDGRLGDRDSHSEWRSA